MRSKTETRISALFITALVSFGTLATGSYAAEPPAIAWPAITPECRPGAYWWWLGSAVNPKDLTRELERYREAGLGAVHIVPIYGAKGYESQFIEYLSPEWMAMLHHAVREARRCDMLVDMTLGTGWCFGGPNVPQEESSALVDIKTFPATGGDAWRQTFDPKSLQALAAFSTDGRWIDLKGRVDRDGVVQWTPEAGSWQVYAVSQVAGKQQVKRAAPGGVGPMLNPFYSTAIRHYVERFTRAFAENEGPGPRAFYHDSYEYRSDWSPDLLAEFAKRRGYRLESKLPVLAGKTADDHAARVKSDYRETISDMMVENFAPVWIGWAHKHSAITRYQAHGSPANLLDLYAQADIPETEMFNKDRSLFISKFASSAAHTAGRKLTAAETGTWLAEHFNETLGEMKDLVDWLFLSGVNHVFYHGTCYSPDDAPWPGWLFYASTEMNPRNSIWRDVPALNAYVARCQSVLQAGKPDNDLLIYWPVFDAWHTPRGLAERGFIVHLNSKWFTGQPISQVSQKLWDRGYAFDYVSDRQLSSARMTEGRIALPGGAYRAIVVPPCEHMPVATLAALIRLAEQGATVVFVDHLPNDVPGAGDLEQRRKDFHAILDPVQGRLAQLEWGIQTAVVGKGSVAVIHQRVAAYLETVGVMRESMIDRQGLQCIRRRMSDGSYYFIVNRGQRPIDGWVPLAKSARDAAILDPMSGRIGTAALREHPAVTSSRINTEVYLQLDPGQSVIVQTFTDHAVAGPMWNYRRIVGTPVDITGPWHVEFITGGPTLPKPRDIEKLASWTGWNDPETERFAGTARYTTTFDAPTPTAEAWQIDLGEVFQSAKVRLNGRDLGTVITRSFRVECDGPLKPTGNVLEVEVTNVSANRIRDMDRRGIEWRKFYDANVVSTRYKPFNAADWPLSNSGLVGPVRLSREDAFTPK